MVMPAGFTHRNMEGITEVLMYHSSNHIALVKIATVLNRSQCLTCSLFPGMVKLAHQSKNRASHYLCLIHPGTQNLVLYNQNSTLGFTVESEPLNHHIWACVNIIWAIQLINLLCNGLEHSWFNSCLYWAAHSVSLSWLDMYSSWVPNKKSAMMPPALQIRYLHSGKWETSW